MKRTLAALSIAGLLSCTEPALADLPVIDIASIAKWIQQAAQMVQQIEQTKCAVASLTNVPPDILRQVTGLLQTSVQNPLGDITRNLNVLMTGRGVGTCAGAQVQLTNNQYAAPIGSDFTAQWMNQSANRNAGLQACTQQMLAGTQMRLAQMPQLLGQLASATSVTQVAVAAARISQEMATINAQQQQAMLISLSAMTQRQIGEDQQWEKMRADAQERINGTAAGPAAAVPIAAPQPFSAN